jgi:O-antigen ligase
MIPVIVKKRLSNLLIAAAVLTSLTVAPYITFDPFNPLKLLVLTTLSGSCLVILITQLNKVTFKIYLFPIIASFLFISALIVSTVLSDQHLITTLYGVTGRHTGVLAYLSFIILYITAVLISSESLALKVAKSIIFVSIITIIYSWIQISGIDPAPWSEGGWVMSFFSNPNFLSSFLGLSAAPAFAFMFDFSTTRKNRIFLIIYALLVLITIVQTKSIQGLIVYVIVLSCVLYLKINSLEKLLKFKKYYLPTVFIFFTWAILDILQKTPGESIIYKLSVSSRGDFWRAAWKMGMDKPFFGWGLDALRDRFEFYRDSRHAARGEGHMLVEIAHNVFLDMFVGGGFLLFIAYLILILVSLFRLKSLIFKTSQFNAGFASVFAIAIGFLAQSTISANHLGLAVWGWISLGILAGYNKNASDLPPITKIDSKGQKLTGQSRLSNSKKTGIFGSLVGVICGVAVSMPLVLVNTQQQSAVDNQNPNQVFESALAWPQDLLKMCILAERLKASGFESESLTIIREAHKFTPYSVVPLKILLTFNSITEEERKQTLKKIKIMDPYFELAEKTRSKQLKN